MTPFVRYYSFPNSDDSSPICGITVSLAGPMKAGIDDDNRNRVFRTLGISPDVVIALKQTHSRVVRIATTSSSLPTLSEGDGILTRNKELYPSVTVADCMPIFLFDPVTRCFGVLHSGWRGTGIVQSALELAMDEWDAQFSDFRVILGPHIRSCCYTVDEERARFFTDAYGSSCVSLDDERFALGNAWPYRLSLAEANRQLCISLGVPDANILDTGECTACNTEFGSSRREGPSSFTHMAAFIHWH